MLETLIAYVEYVKRSLLGFVIWLFSLSVIFGMASGIYSVVYFMYMPSQSYQVPLDLAFKPCPPQYQNTKAMFKCSFPQASVVLPPLTSGTPYIVSVDLTVFPAPPSSSVSGGGRTFMACLYGLEGGEVCKPVTLTVKSGLAQVVDFFLIYPWAVVSHGVSEWSLSQASDLKENVLVDFHKSYVPEESSSTKVRVELMDVTLSVTSALVTVHKADFNEVQHLMWHHPLVSKSVGVACLSLAIILVAVNLWNFVTRPKTVSSAAAAAAAVNSSSCDSFNKTTTSSRRDLARARLGKIDSGALLRDLMEEFLVHASHSDHLNLISILSNLRKDNVSRNIQQYSPLNASAAAAADGSAAVSVGGGGTTAVSSDEDEKFSQAAQLSDLDAAVRKRM